MKKMQLCEGRAIILGFAAVAAMMLASSVMSKSVTAAGTFTVSNTMDSGSGSLRQAINDANAAGGGTIDATGVASNQQSDGQLSVLLRWTELRRRRDADYQG